MGPGGTVMGAILGLARDSSYGVMIAPSINDLSGKFILCIGI
jgi:hypothetical protein